MCRDDGVAVESLYSISGSEPLRNLNLVKSRFQKLYLIKYFSFD